MNIAKILIDMGGVEGVNRMIEVGTSAAGGILRIIDMIKQGHITPTPAVDGTPRTYEDVKAEADFALDKAFAPLDILEATVRLEQEKLAAEHGQVLPPQTLNPHDPIDPPVTDPTIGDEP